ncbi:organic cation/carnitine transporter 3-like [Malania oleifera]|uniref:organic cation/carnitine transporter 3-like n=1 Tax=Malania oleifera TaxID=397392 RepID=UPI0025AE8FF3|nr:organic cation/carnitine transporter 3-like [Malania oleifera]
MADSTPLLPESNSANSEKHLSPSLDDAIEHCIGQFGTTQFLQALLVSLAWAFDAQQAFISIFADADPCWHYTTQPPTDSSCNSPATTVCRLPPTSWAWDRSATLSTVSEWALQCSGPVVAGLPASSFFVGCLVGGIVLSSLSDSSLGRKTTLLLSCLLMSLTALLTAFSPNIWVYSALKFVVGFGRSAVGGCAIVLSTETVGKRWRGQVSIIGFFCFTLGFLSLPAIAFINRGSSWRLLYLWTSIPTLFYCVLIHFFVRESPRWLFVQGRREEAIATLKSIAAKKNLTVSFSGVEPIINDDARSSLELLLGKRWALRRLSGVMAVGFGLGIVYYGMPLAVGSLPFDLYLSVTLNALAEFPASLATLLLIRRLSRRSGVAAFCGVSGVCSVACAWAGGAWTVGLELASFFSACTAFNVVFIYTVELFPTCVRNLAMAMVRQAVVVGGVFSPAVVAAGRRKGWWWSYGVFGVMIGCCGLFAMCLPETKGRLLSDTMAEEEEMNGTAATAAAV